MGLGRASEMGPTRHDRVSHQNRNANRGSGRRRGKDEIWNILFTMMEEKGRDFKNTAVPDEWE